MNPRRLITMMGIAAAVLPSILSPARGDVLGQREARFTSNLGVGLYLGAATLLPLVEDGSLGKNHTLRALDAFGVSTAISEGLKFAVREPRPGGVGHDGFPSGHATAAFTLATMQSAFHPRQAPLWYAGATLIGISRVDLHEHQWHDVVAGAIIGFATARWELSQHRGLILQPWIEPDVHSAGFSFSMSF